MAPPKSKAPRILHTPMYLGFRSLAALVGSLPSDQALPMASAMGRAYAGSALNRKRLGRAADNLGVAFPGWDEERRRAVAVRSWEHLALLGTEIVYCPRLLTEDGWGEHISLGEVEAAMQTMLGGGPVILITGHCGNWEVLGYTLGLLGYPVHALYRPLDLPPLDAWVRGQRQRRGLTLVDKFGALRQLPELVAGGAPVAFVADQNGGDRGTFVPFFNRLTSTYKSIGLLAMQFGATVICGCARRVGGEEEGIGAGEVWRGFPGMRFRMEVVDMFGPADWATHPDPLFYLTARYRRAIEVMVKRAPEQYLWMHRIWRSRPRHERMGRPMPESLVEKLKLLPWMTQGDVEEVRAWSERDARTLAETGKDRLA